MGVELKTNRQVTTSVSTETSPLNWVGCAQASSQELTRVCVGGKFLERSSEEKRNRMSLLRAAKNKEWDELTVRHPLGSWLVLRAEPICHSYDTLLVSLESASSLKARQRLAESTAHPRGASPPMFQ